MNIAKALILRLASARRTAHQQMAQAVLAGDAQKAMRFAVTEEQAEWAASVLFSIAAAEEGQDAAAQLREMWQKACHSVIPYMAEEP